MSPAANGASADPLDIRQLFQLALDRHASDLHLTEGLPPTLRIDGALVRAELPALSRLDTKRLIYGLLTDRQKQEFEREQELDLSVDVEGLGRFRVNVHVQRGSAEAAFRLVPSRIPTLAELGLPPVAADVIHRPNGLVLVTGPTGMGKSTTLAAMIDLLNREKPSLIITIEDPIEYLHENRCAVIKQREVHADTKSFSAALTHALRQDPNIIVVGEMRDLETISTALTAAETGHLVLATLHTPDAPQTIDRILDIFPPSQQQQVKIQLSDCLQAVISQQLLPRHDRPGRILACEVLVATPAVRHLIREHATAQLPTTMQTGKDYGMRTMDHSLQELFMNGLISYETARTHAKHPEELDQLADQLHRRSPKTKRA